jgi:hypothetical protein
MSVSALTRIATSPLASFVPRRRSIFLLLFNALRGGGATLNRAPAKASGQEWPFAAAPAALNEGRVFARFAAPVPHLT